MCKFYNLVILVLITGTVKAQTGDVGVNISAPKATLDVFATTTTAGHAEGIIAPRLTRAQLVLKNADYGTDQNASIVYVSDVSGGSATGKTVNVTVSGYYYYDALASVWRALGSNVYTFTHPSVGSVGITVNGGTLQTLSVNDADSVVGNEITDAANGTLVRSGSGTAGDPYLLARAALTGDVTAAAGSNTTVIAPDAVTTGKIANGTILAEDLNQMGASSGQVLQWNGSVWAPANAATTEVDGVIGNEILNATNGLTRTGTGTTADPFGVKLGGSLSEPTTITTTSANTLAIAGLQTGSNADSVVTMGAGGVLHRVAPTDPWYQAGLTTQATANTQNIYQNGNVGIGGAGHATAITPAATLQVLGNPGVATSLDGIIAPVLSGSNLAAKTYTSAQRGAIVYITGTVSLQNISDNPTQLGNIYQMGNGYFFFDGTQWQPFAPPAVGGDPFVGNEVIDAYDGTLVRMGTGTTANDPSKLRRSAIGMTDALNGVATGIYTGDVLIPPGSSIATVKGIQSHPVSADAPNNGDVLVFDNTVTQDNVTGTWVPKAPNDWLLTGNNGITAANYLGTQNNIGLMFRVNAGTGATPAAGSIAGYISPADNASNYNAFGLGALAANTGVNNNAFGLNALKANTSGQSNNAFGANALAVNNGNNNNAFGSGALFSNVSGTANNAFGYNTLSVNDVGINNSAFGDNSLAHNHGGHDNVAFGNNTLSGNNAGNYNTAVGTGSLLAGDQSYNVGIGYNAASGGSSNIVIGGGSAASVVTAAGSNQLNIGNTLYGTGVNGALNNTAGKIGVNTNNPQSALEVNGAATNTPVASVTTATADFTLSNLAATSNAGATVLSGLRDGGTYTLAWTALGTAVTPPTLTGGTNNGTITTLKNLVGIVTIKTNTQSVLFTIICIGNTAYVSATLYN
ncbi:hypothetical protein [Fluviicola sp.]|jgi:hypothetical protein|uniref:beta strand repeat-containing protein n=1 Tax=Fluviicola sp. TaxID=1917219 RepID=UPI00281BD908|nr:hypothetical protein [Fluviicola sp.]MDR0802791.1 hypothetical protein [Fluviicola sp.]